MAFRSSDYPLTGLGFATGQNSDTSSETSLNSADSGDDISMLDFTVSDTDGVSGPSIIGVGNTGTVTQNFTGESSRFSVIKGVDQNFTWSSSDTSILTVGSGDFTVTATAQDNESTTVSSDFHDRYNTVSSQNGGSTNVIAGNCNFAGSSLFTTFNSVTPTTFPEIRAEVSINNNTYGEDGSLDASNFEVCERFETQNIKNVNFSTGSGSKIDVLVTFDASGSTGDIKTALKNGIEGLVNDLNSAGFDSRYGLVVYESFVENRVTLSGSTGTELVNAVENINPSGGGEPGYYAIEAALNNRTDTNGDNMGDIRSDARPVLITATDEDADEPGGTGQQADQQDVINSLDSQGIEYKAIAPTGSGNFDYKPVTDALGNKGTFFDVDDNRANVDRYFDTIFDSLVNPSYRILYDTTNNNADGSTRNVQVKVIPPSGSGDSEMVVTRQYDAP
jgi:hypothetical protein